MPKKLLRPLAALCLGIAVRAAAAPAPNAELADPALRAKVEALLSRMTLEEKVGQMVGFPASKAKVGPELGGHDFNAMIAAGRIGEMNVSDVRQSNAYQRIAVEKTRLHIPLLFGLDVIHGYRTTYPIPLGVAATFDPDLAAELAHMAAKEARADGIRMTNAPMVDIARDARWGRTAEGAGESPFLGSAFARAYVRGFQGDSLAGPDSIVACVKHFAGYGAVIAGRDYNAADMSDITLRQVYLPPYQAAVDAGAGAVMAAFNSLNSVPETEDPYTLTEILRKEWGFEGLVRSDYNAVAELVAHGVALDGGTAVREAVEAGVDLDMASDLYNEDLASLVRGGAVPESTVDEAARRILRVKFAAGLFDHPYVDENAPPDGPTPAKRALALRAAEESIVLLQNRAPGGGKPSALPIGPGVKTIALIGPLAGSGSQMLGTWHGKGQAADAVTLRAALGERMRARGGRVLYAEGTQILTDSEDGFGAARDAAAQADLVVLAFGEDAHTMTGEAASRADLDLPGNQERLLETVAAAGKPVVLVVFSGRPLVLTRAAERVSAIVEAWYPGIEAGNALADILFGDVNPSGRLPVSFPRAVGQEPLYLSQFPTGRPAIDVDPSNLPTRSSAKFVSRYIDVPNTPLFAFGEGLSYTDFEYTPVLLSASALHVNQVMRRPGEGADGPSIEASATVRNAGPRAGVEVVQLYLRIRGASVEEPVRVLEGFQRVGLAPGESKEVHFPLGFGELSIIDRKSRRVVEPAEYTVYIGGNSEASQSAKFLVVP